MTTQTFISDDREKILTYAQERFFKEGFYKISMDEIARELGMSKSTIYKYFPSKVELVNDAVKTLVASVKIRIESAISMDSNAVEKFLAVIKILTETITRFTDKWLSDLQHHAPQIWEEVDETRRKLLYENISKLISQGQREVLIKKYPPEIIITLITGAMRNIVNPAFLISTRFSYDDAVEYAFKILLNGILTEKGQKILEQLKLQK
ncbi:MAG: TetR/AcrR family transcriptional regulator [Chlorobi bacterium]|nr:TetR/AcrR family transcriptional regulator [Chlorobiota bacterium]MCI0715356.1 TetR/AcrR family transcriptional regulator [Chlorobiota bacterium]